MSERLSVAEIAVDGSDIHPFLGTDDADDLELDAARFPVHLVDDVAVDGAAEVVGPLARLLVEIIVVAVGEELVSETQDVANGVGSVEPGVLAAERVPDVVRRLQTQHEQRVIGDLVVLVHHDDDLVCRLRPLAADDIVLLIEQRLIGADLVPARAYVVAQRFQTALQPAESGVLFEQRAHGIGEGIELHVQLGVPRRRSVDVHGGTVVVGHRAERMVEVLVEIFLQRGEIVGAEDLADVGSYVAEELARSDDAVVGIFFAGVVLRRQHLEDGGHVERLAVDGDGILRKGVLLEHIDVVAHSAREREHEQYADDAYAPRKRGEHGPALLAEQVGPREADRRPEAHGGLLLELAPEHFCFEESGEPLLLLRAALYPRGREKSPARGEAFVLLGAGAPVVLLLLVRRERLFGGGARLPHELLFDGFVLVRVRHGVAHDLAVAEIDDAGAVLLRELSVVGDHDDQAVAGDFLEQLHDLHAGFAVEGARRLVGEDDLGIADYGARYRDALHLPAGKLAGALLRLLLQPHSPQRFEGALAALVLVNARESESELHILQHADVRDEIVALEDEAYALIAVSVPIEIVVIFGGDALHLYVAAGVSVQSAYYVEQRGLAAARRSQDGHEFVSSESHREVVESEQALVLESVLLCDVDEFEHNPSVFRGRCVHARVLFHL